MNMMANLKSDDSIQNETDTLGGGGPLDTDIYAMEVVLAYLEKSNSGAMGLHVHFKTDQGSDLRQAIYMTSGDAKGNRNYYERDGEKHYLPGFILGNSLALLTVGKEIGDLETEEKVVKLYDYNEGKEVPTTVNAVTALHGKQIYGAVFRQTVSKRAKGDDGVYRPTGETREINEVDKFFRAKDKMTTAEIRGQADSPEFFNRWLDKWQGEVRDRTDKDAPAGNSGAPSSAKTGAAKKPETSLFS